jgi:SAM-dependent methyltransferase
MNVEVEINANKFAEYTELGDSAWNVVERRVLDFVLRTRFRDHYNWLNNSENRDIPAIGTKYNSWIPQDFRALDLGTGIGQVPKALMDFGVDPKNIVGIDNNMAMLNHPKFPESVRGLSGDIREVDKVILHTLSNFGHFDFVTANMVYHYFSYQDYVRSLKKVRKIVTDNSYLYIMVPHPLRDSIPSAAQYHTRSQIDERTPWGEEISLYKKTIDDYLRGLEEADFDCRWLRTTGDGLKIEDNYLNSDESTRVMIRDIKRGNFIGDIPHYLRVWFLAYPV